MKLILLPVAFALGTLEIAKKQLCNLNYAACIKGDTSYGADCAAHPELGADFLCNDDCSAHFEDIGGEKYENYQGFCGLKSLCPPGGCVSMFNIDRIDGYGCWCNFEENLMEGSANPVNVYDSLCRKFQLCLRCAKIDGKNEGYGCNPKTESWLGKGDQSFSTDCSSHNGGLCGESVCSCAVNFIQRVFELLWVVPSVYEPAYKHENGFDKVASCPPSEHPRNDVQCCGYWPDRFPYGGFSDKECCDQRQLYNPVSQICCNDGSVKNTGQMC